MKMRLIFLLLTLVAGPAQASTIVLSDSGNIGEFRATNTGVSASGTARIVFAAPETSSQMNTVNGAFIVAEKVSVNTPLVVFVTPAGANSYAFQLDPATYHETIGDLPGAQAILDFQLTTGATTPGLPAFFNVSGLVAGLSANLDPLFDFSRFASGTGVINFTFTTNSFQGADSFQSFLATPDAVAVGNGSFSQAVSEPASMIMLGAGLCGALLLGCNLNRRFGS